MTTGRERTQGEIILEQEGEIITLRAKAVKLLEALESIVVIMKTSTDALAVSVIAKKAIAEYKQAVASDKPEPTEPHQHGWDPTTRTFYPD
jgi:hypothetical protein